MKPIYYLFFLLSLVLAIHKVDAQEASGFLNRAMKSANDYILDHPVEKVYLQLDKSYYAAGDDIWLKGYVTVGAQHKLSAVSNVLNVELLNCDGKLLQFIKLPLIEGLTWGDFKLPDTIKTGNYYVRAYTQWMLNSGIEFLFEKKIEVGNAKEFGQLQESITQREKNHQNTEVGDKASHGIDVQFFPEGGNVICGIESKVAFKAIGENGLGKDITGMVVDNDDKEVVAFRSEHLGMGVFSFIPLTGKSYTARIVLRNGKTIELPLPTALTSGYCLSVDGSDPSFINARIQVGNSVHADSTEVYLVGQTVDGEIKYAAKAKSKNASFDAKIPKSKFPAGIIRFTLFSSTGEPLNERVIFIDNISPLNVTVTEGDSNSGRRQKIKMGFRISDQSGQSVSGNFSVAVLDLSHTPTTENDNNILSSLLLTSDIKGFVEQPGYYFNSGNSKRHEYLDLLMMTQGFRSFAWKSMLTGQPATSQYPPEAALEIRGTVESMQNKPVPFASVSLLGPLNGKSIRDTIADKNGEFVFRNLEYIDSSNFIISGKSGKNQTNVKLNLAPDIIPKFEPTDRSVPANMAQDTMAAMYLKNSLQRNQQDELLRYGKNIKPLKEVTIRGQKTLENSANLNGAGNADQVLLAKDMNSGCQTVMQCLQGKLRYVTIGFDSYGVGRAYSRNGEMALYVDGIKSGAETLNTLLPNMIESVEVLINNSVSSVYGSEGYHGVLIINTKHGGFNSASSATNVLRFRAKGYYKVRVFYSPKYGHESNNETRPDLRSTIYWDPNITTNTNGVASIEFYNADSSSVYQVTFEGIDAAGNLARKVFYYRVNQ